MAMQDYHRERRDYYLTTIARLIAMDAAALHWARAEGREDGIRLRSRALEVGGRTYAWLAQEADETFWSRIKEGDAVDLVYELAKDAAEGY